MTEKRDIERKEDGEESRVTEPVSEIIQGTGGKGFVGIFIALVALAVMLWVGTRLVVPYPNGEAPDEALEDVSESLPGDFTSNGAQSVEASQVSAGLEPESAQAGAGLEPETEESPSEYQAALQSSSSDNDPVCGMPLDRSSNLVSAKFGDEWVGFVSLACYFQYAEGKSPDEVTVLDYSTWRKEPGEKVMVPIKEALFLIAIDGSLPGAMPPGVAAFSDEVGPHLAAGDLGGRTADYAEMESFVNEQLEKEGLL